MTIKTLSEVLAEMGESPVSADNHQIQVLLDETNFINSPQPSRQSLTVCQKIIP